MTYFRRQPWRPRSPWLGNRTGARRRGIRQDALCPPPDARQDGVDLVLSVAYGAAPAESVLIAELAPEPAAPNMVAARVDLSGLLAIASVAPRPVSLADRDGSFPTAGWQMHDGLGEEESLLNRHSA